MARPPSAPTKETVKATRATVRTNIIINKVFNEGFPLYWIYRNNGENEGSSLGEPLEALPSALTGNSL